MQCVIVSIVSPEHLECYTPAAFLIVQCCMSCCLVTSLFVPAEEEIIVSCRFLAVVLRKGDAPVARSYF